MVQKILSIDAGGSKGIIPIAWLIEIERYTKKRIGEIFDTIVTTSTSSIIAIAINNDISAINLMDLYIEYFSGMFTKSLYYDMTTLFGLIGSKYDIRNHDKIINDITSDIKMAELKKNTIITVNNIEKKPYHTEYSKSKALNRPDLWNIPVQDVIKKSLDSFMYLQSLDIMNQNNIMYNFINYGMGINNPALSAYQDKSIIVSLGCGYKDDEDHINESMKNIMGDDYYRLNVCLDENYKYDETDLHVLKQMSKDIKKKLNIDEYFKKMCDRLLWNM